jgi:hypothetical protein
MQLISSIDFKKPPPQPNGAPSNPGNNPGGYSPVSNPASSNMGSNTSVPLRSYVLYMSVKGDLLSNAEISVLYFLPDGTVYADIPEKGFEGFNAMEQKAKTPEVFGNFTSSGNNIIIRMNGEANGSSYTMRPDGSLQSAVNPALVFSKMESLDQYRIDGSYIQKDGSREMSLTFTKDNLFTDNGLIKSIRPNSDLPASGNGKYRIIKNSLILQYTDGRLEQLNIYLMPADYNQGDKPFKILVNNYVLTRM